MLNMFTFDAFSVCHSLSQPVTGITFFIFQLMFYILYKNLCLGFKRILTVFWCIFVQFCRLSAQFLYFYLCLTIVIVSLSIQSASLLICLLITSSSQLWKGCPCIFKSLPCSHRWLALRQAGERLPQVSQNLALHPKAKQSYGS